MTNCYFISVTARYTFYNTASLVHSRSRIKNAVFIFMYAKWFNDDTFFDDFEKFNYLCGSLLCVYGILQFVMKLHSHARTYAYSNNSDSSGHAFSTAVFSMCVWCIVNSTLNWAKTTLFKLILTLSFAFTFVLVAAAAATAQCSYTSHGVMMLKLSVNTTWRCKYSLKILSKYL